MGERGFFLELMVGIFAIISFLMIKPFLGYILGALLLAFILHPIHRKFRLFLGSRISAFTVVILGVLVAVVPFILAAGAVAEDANNLAKDVNRTSLINITEIEGQIMEYTGRSIDIEANIRSTVTGIANSATGNVPQFVGLIMHVTIGLTIMIFLMYYLIRDGEMLVNWLRDVAPVRDDLQDELYSEVNNTTWAVIKGHVLVAVVQGLVAGLGLFITGVPNYAFWTFVMVLLGFIPIVGTIVVWLPASGYLFIVGQEAAALFLLVYGFIVVGFTDNILRPLAVDRGSNLHPAVILLGVIGGVYLLGAVGLFVGPIILGILKSTILVAKKRYEDL